MQADAAVLMRGTLRVDCLAGNMWRDGRFNILVRDARAENFVGGGFDAIHVGAAVDSLRSAEHLAAMLRPGGAWWCPWARSRRPSWSWIRA